MASGQMGSFPKRFMSDLQGARIFISGIVQGVGFRPFVYALAQRYNLTGWVRNTSAGVDIEVDGDPEQLAAFVAAIRQEAPPLAYIDRMEVDDRPANGFSEFEIRHSEPIPNAFQPISPDVSLCDDCRRELFDPSDRRYRYPFINCTNCGPRFTIIKDIPYDRPKTTMAPFEMCPECRFEYEDPADRRFHAQPVACPVCGPQIWLEVEGSRLGEREEALRLARRMLREGKIVAVRGLGGFHLACDAANSEAVEELRRRKFRVDKAFAVMMPDVASIESQCQLNPPEIELLTSSARPVVILERRLGSDISPAVAPGQSTLGVMLPYTPLHELLLEPEPGYPRALVMTSGNLSEEPIATGNQEARKRLADLADAFLLHDRDIHVRCDDSVYRVFRSDRYPIRRSRGYAPYPVPLPWEAPSLLATGPELKNTFCLTRDKYAFVSHHIGDMENYETLQSFQDGIEHFERLFRIQPTAIAYDLHPNYMATRYALDRAQARGLPGYGVQHHHAHIAACMADNRLKEGVVIGFAFDGTGYGEDGAIWGGEVLLADYVEYERSYHLEYIPMPGGEAAIRQPWRLALAWLRAAGLVWDEGLAPAAAASLSERQIIDSMLEGDVNAPQTSSLGRLFDAVAALSGGRQVVNYEAQAAIEFEAALDPGEKGHYQFEVDDSVIQVVPVIRQVVADVQAGVRLPVISARFHNGLAALVLQLADHLRNVHGVERVALSGGVWQNMVLLRLASRSLQQEGFEVLTHRRVPTNDGGVALGQAAVAARRIEAGWINGDAAV
jgi:hydrogenase maturation protein HypF